VTAEGNDARRYHGLWMKSLERQSELEVEAERLRAREQRLPALEMIASCTREMRGVGSGKRHALQAKIDAALAILDGFSPACSCGKGTR
jgi:hypothetical protein